MTVQEVMAELESYGNENTKKTFLKHGAKEPYFGVKVGDMKKIQKKIKKDHELALALYDTNNSDAMYFAGLIADEKQMTKADLQKWAKNATWSMISEYTVPWIAAESDHGFELAIEWIESDREAIASSGWATLGSLVSIKKDEDLDILKLEALMNRVIKEIHDAPNRVRYTMNGFVIAIGGYVESLTEKAYDAGKQIGKVEVDMNGTACKVPLAPDYIKKMVDKGRVGKKRKMARC